MAPPKYGPCPNPQIVWRQIRYLHYLILNHIQTRGYSLESGVKLVKSGSLGEKECIYNILYRLALYLQYERFVQHRKDTVQQN